MQDLANVSGFAEAARDNVHYIRHLEIDGDVAFVQGFGRFDFPEEVDGFSFDVFVVEVQLLEDLSDQFFTCFEVPKATEFLTHYRVSPYKLEFFDFCNSEDIFCWGTLLPVDAES